MPASEPRPRSAFVWAAIVFLALIFAGLTLYQILGRDRSEMSAERVRELTSAVPRPASTTPPAAGDWPQWRGPNRDGVSTETGLLTEWPEGGPKVLWSRPAGDGYSSIVVSRGRAFTMVQDGEDEAVVCWDAVDGTERWRYRYPAHFRHRQYGDGPRSTPAVAGDLMYTVGGTGIMHCLKAFTSNPAGEVVWRKDLREAFGGPLLEWGIAFSPQVVGRLVYTMPGGPDGRSLAALDKDTGAVVWHQLDDPPSYSSPVVGDLAGRPQAVFLTGRRLVGLAADTGRLLWEYPWDPGPAHTPSHISTPLVIHLDVGDYVFNASGYDKGCALLKIVPDGEACRAELVYKNRSLRTVFSSAVREGDYLYGFDDTNLACIDLRRGKRMWSERGFGKGSLTLADGMLIILGEHGTLALAAADPHEYRERSRFEHSEQIGSWTVPVVAGGRLYVRDKNRVVCYDIKKSP